MAGKSFFESPAFWGALMCFFGSFCLIINRIEYSLKSIGTEYCVKDDGIGETLSCSFNKPYWLVVQMKVGACASSVAVIDPCSALTRTRAFL